MLKQLVEQSERSAVHVFAADDVIAGPEQLHDGVETAHAAGERKSVTSVFQGGDVALEGFARGILAPRIFVSLVLPEPFLDVGRGQVDRRHDRASKWLGSLTRVNGPRAKAGGHVLIKNARHTDTLVLGDGCKITEPPH